MVNVKLAALNLLNPTGKNGLPQVDVSQTPSELQKILSLVFVIIGAMSVMLLVIAGFRYVISGGDATKIAETKKAIIYTIVGIIVSASAYIIVNAVLGQTTQGQ